MDRRIKPSASSSEPRPTKPSEQAHYVLIDAAQKLDLDLTEPLALFAPTPDTQATVKGDQWEIARGTHIAKFGTSTGRLSTDREIAHSRLTGIAEWADNIRKLPVVADAIGKSREALRQFERLSRRGAQLSADSIRIGNQVLTEENAALVFEEPHEAWVAMREMVADTASYKPLVKALKEDPEQFGAIRKRSFVSAMFGRDSDLTAQSTLDHQIIPDLEEAAGREARGKRARQSANEVLAKTPIDHQLLYFADAQEALSEKINAPEFLGLEADIAEHKRFDELVDVDPVGALELAQKRALSIHGNQLWYDIAHATAENVRDNHAWADAAEARGIIPERTLPYNARIEPKPPGHRPRPGV